MVEPVLKYHPSGILISKTFYKKDGVTKHGNPAEIIYDEKGNKLVERRYNNGVIQSEFFYRSNGKQDYDVYYERGVVLRKIFYYDFGEEKLDFPLHLSDDEKREIGKRILQGFPVIKLTRDYLKGKLFLEKTYYTDNTVKSFKEYKDGKLHSNVGFATYPEKEYFLEGHEINFIPDDEIDIAKISHCSNKVSKNLKIQKERLFKALSNIVYDKPVILPTSDTCTTDTKQSLITMEEYEGSVVAIKKRVKGRDITVCFSCEDLGYMTANRQATTYPHLPLKESDYIKLYNFYETKCKIN